MIFLQELVKFQQFTTSNNARINALLKMKVRIYCLIWLNVESTVAAVFNLPTKKKGVLNESERRMN